MNQHRREIVADCLDRLGDGNLTADELRHAFEQFAEAPRRHTDDFSHLKAGGMYMRRNFLESYDAAHMYMWLCGHEDEFRYVGGTAWPAPRDTWPAHIDNYAVPPSLSGNGTAYQPEAPPMLRHS